MADSEVPGDVIKCTQETLGKFVKKPTLTEKLLKKPPFRFLFDVFKAIIKETGYFEGLYTAAELNYENIKDRDDKIKFLQKMIDAMKLIITDRAITVRPSKIVAGQEPEKTNELLQLIGKVLEQQLDWHNAVQQLSADVPAAASVEKPKDPKHKEKDAERVKEKSRDKTKERDSKAMKELKSTSKSKSTNEEKAEKIKKLEKDKLKDKTTTKTTKDKGNELKKETKKLSPTGIKEKAKTTKTRTSESQENTPSPKAPKEVKERERHKETENGKERDKEKERSNEIEKVKSKERTIKSNSLEKSEQEEQQKPLEQPGETEKRNSASKRSPSSKLTAKTVDPSPLKSEQEKAQLVENRVAPKMDNENLQLQQREASGDAGSRTSSAQRKSGSGKSSRRASRTDTQTLAAQSSVELEGVKEEMVRQPIKAQPAEPTAEPKQQSQIEEKQQTPPTTVAKEPPIPSVKRENTFTRENSREAVRPRTSLRPPSARPASARPGAPRRRDKNIEIILQPNDQIKMSGINVKLETFGDFDDDGENLVVIEDANADPLQDTNTTQHSSDMDALNDANNLEQQGHLVQQILETQKELVQQNTEEQNKAAKEQDNLSSYNARQSSARQMTSLRDVIQALTKSVNPLGKLMDFIPEDIDAMQLELTMWRDTYAQAASELKRERSLTESTTEPMKNQLTQIELNIKEYVEMIDASRMKIIQNSEKILKLLMEQ